MVGPSVIGFLDATVLDNLQIVNGVAVSLIALTAGTELRIDRVRPLARTIGLTTALGVVGGALAIAATVFLLRGQIAFLSVLPRRPGGRGRARPGRGARRPVPRRGRRALRRAPAPTGPSRASCSESSSSPTCS